MAFLDGWLKRVSCVVVLGKGKRYGGWERAEVK